MCNKNILTTCSPAPLHLFPTSFLVLLFMLANFQNKGCQVSDPYYITEQVYIIADTKITQPEAIT